MDNPCMIRLNIQASRIFSFAITILLAGVLTFAQQGRGSIRGLVKDEFGAAIVGATVTISDSSGVQKTANTNGEGVYTVAGLLPGKYSVQSTAKGFAVSENSEVVITAGQRTTLDFTLKVTLEEQNVTVAAESPVSVEPTNNANQTIITGRDL